ncbi:hypothetical protein BBMN23_1499 [Bifidobacterium adolescentis]|uniref:Uncharacterized protein n=1 Tax=Bifidobacterium adolescentis L2-32 TaxID=411481 RepID=A7A6R8_BIFAD|nr:hypothetical protein BBMN23_1499 [Bifidobacterium adolescentis]EDN82500.1 hypothetical protein BIFADO_01550 [Bifidobacterium adolescentis L2-32]
MRRLFSGECVRHTRERMSAESHLTLPASLHLTLTTFATSRRCVKNTTFFL